MRKCSPAGRFLLFRTRNAFSHLHLSQRWNSSTKAAPPNDDGVLDLLDQAGQNISIATDPHRQKRRKAAEPDTDESVQKLHSATLDLPLSPLMDPRIISARQRYRTPKVKSTSPPSKFEQMLSKSPYGMYYREGRSWHYRNL